MQLVSTPLVRQLGIIFAGALVLSLPLWLFGWDAALVKIAHGHGEGLAWALRQHSALPILALTLAALVFLVLPAVRHKFPLMRQCALIWIFVLVLGAGLFNQVVMKDVVQRPRPRDTQLLGAEQAEAFSFFNKAALRGRSFPSGHAGAGFMLMVPFFALWPKRRKLALSVLVLGAAYGFFIGWGRMALGAHYLTDVIWAGALVLAAAAIATKIITPKTNLPAWVMLAFIVFSALCITLFNKFNVTLHHKVNLATELKIPCVEDFVVLQKGDKIGVHLKGYGGPLSTLVLVEKEQNLTLRRWPGIFHSLKCSIKIIEDA